MPQPRNGGRRRPFHETDPESVRRRLSEIGEEEQRHGRAYRKAVLLLILWPVLGLPLMAWGFQMNDPVWGSTVFYGGAALANIGIVATLAWAYREHER